MMVTTPAYRTSRQNRNNQLFALAMTFLALAIMFVLSYTFIRAVFSVFANADFYSVPLLFVSGVSLVLYMRAFTPVFLRMVRHLGKNWLLILFSKERKHHAKSMSDS